MEAEIRSQFPHIDPVVSEYSAGYLNHASNTFIEDADVNGPTPLLDAASAIRALLLSASGDFSTENDNNIKTLVDKFVARLQSKDVNGERRHAALSNRRLDQTINVGSQRGVSSTMGLASGNVDLESANARKVESRVDKKKLEKAERKIQAKQDKKVMKNVEYEASKLLNIPDEAASYEEFYMAVNPLQLGEANTKSKDIKVDGIDITIGGLRILTDTNLTLAYGRRYGLVGQNGIGKSTLLRALAKREVAIPTHISILHVEQEVSALMPTLDIPLMYNRLPETTHLRCRPCLMRMYGASIFSRSKK